jgi:hypothetical protein
VAVGLVGCSCGKKSNQTQTNAAAAVGTGKEGIPLNGESPARKLTCPDFHKGRKLGNVANSYLAEASGLAVSHKNPSVLWSHNDSGGTAQLFAMTEDGRDLGTYHLAKTKLEDWEDLALGPAEEPGEWYIYIGDIGTNTKPRTRVSVYRIREPKVMLDQEPEKHKVKDITRFDFNYPDQGNHDAETLMVDPRSGDLYIVTKPHDSTPTVYRAKAPLVPKTTQVLEEVEKLTVFDQGKRRSTLVTAGDISPDGSQILIRTYTSAYLWLRSPGESVADSLKREPCPVPLANEPHGETIAFSADGKAYFTVSEGANPKLFRFDIKP